MKHTAALVVLLLGASILLAGCASVSQREVARVAAEVGAPASVVKTMERGERLSLPQVEALAQSGVPDAQVIQYLEQTATAYTLTAAQTEQLRATGVSDQVIDYLLSTPARFAQRYRGYYSSRAQAHHHRASGGQRAHGHGHHRHSGHHGGRH